jgi:hypothetical protein
VDRIRKAIHRLLDLVDPPKAPPPPLAACPSCGGDVSEQNEKSEVRNDLVYFRCICGHASAWYWNGHGPQLIYGQEPSHDPEVFEGFD